MSICRVRYLILLFWYVLKELLCAVCSVTQNEFRMKVLLYYWSWPLCFKMLLCTCWPLPLQACLLPSFDPHTYIAIIAEICQHFSLFLFTLSDKKCCGLLACYTRFSQVMSADWSWNCFWFWADFELILMLSNFSQKNRVFSELTFYRCAIFSDKCSRRWGWQEAGRGVAAVTGRDQHSEIREQPS